MQRDPARRFSTNCIIRNEDKDKNASADGEGALGTARISQIKNAGKSASSRGLPWRPDSRKPRVLVWETGDAEVLKVGEILSGNPEPSLERHQPGSCKD